MGSASSLSSNLPPTLPPSSPSSSSASSSSPSSLLHADQQVKIYRQIEYHHAMLVSQGVVDKVQLYDALIQLHSELVAAYTTSTSTTTTTTISNNNSTTKESSPLPPSPPSPSSSSQFQCPKVRFGRTELYMPILTCGGMRQQQTWAPSEQIVTVKDINAECQKNFEAIVERAMQVDFLKRVFVRGRNI